MIVSETLRPAAAKQTPEGGPPLAGDDPVYLPDPVLDATVRMLVELAAQVWVDRERLLVMEQILAERGVVTREAVECFKPGPEQAKRLKEERNRFVEDVFRELRRVPVQEGRQSESRQR